MPGKQPPKAIGVLAELISEAKTYIKSLKTYDNFTDDLINWLDDLISESSDQDISPLSQDYSVLTKAERKDLIIEVFQIILYRDISDRFKSNESNTSND